MEKDKRIVNGDSTEEDQVVDYNARPKFLADYVGQQSVREQLEIDVSWVFYRIWLGRRNRAHHLRLTSYVG